MEDLDLWDRLELAEKKVEAAQVAMHEAQMALHAVREEIGDRPVAPWDEAETCATAAELPKKVAKKKAAKKSTKKRGDWADQAADELNKIYPHGYSDAGNKRKAGLKESAAALRRLRAKGYSLEEITEATEAYREAVVGTPDQQFVPSMFRWLRNEEFREVADRVAGKPKPPTPEEVAERLAREEEAADERMRRRAERAGVQLAEGAS